MRIAVFRPGHTTPLYVGDTVDDCLEWIGERIGCNWATHLDTGKPFADDSRNVVATRTKELMEFTIGPASVKDCNHD